MGARLASGLGLLLVVLSPALCGQTSSPTAWTQTVRAADIVYFGFANPARIERYDLARDTWLTSIALPASPTALHADADGIYWASNRALYKRALDGTNEQPIYNSPLTITGVLSDGTYIFVFSPGYANNRIDSVRKSDLQFVATWTGTYSLTAGFSIAPDQRRIYGVNTETTAFSTLELPYNADGTFGTVKELRGSGNFSDRPHTWVGNNERALVRSNGEVFSIPNLTSRGSLAGGVDDAVYYGTDVLIALRGNKLVAFDSNFLESGTYVLPAMAHGLAVRSDQIYVFTQGATAVTVAKVPVASLNAARPGDPVDPTLLSFIPSDVVQAEDGTLLMLSKSLQSIFRWSPASRSYTASYPLLGTPISFAYSPTLRRIYTGYSTGAINQIKLDQGATAEVPFVNLMVAPGILVPVDDLLFVAGDYNYYTSDIFDQNGVSKYHGSAGYSSSFLWSSSQRRMYYLDSYRLKYYPISATGLPGTTVSGPYDYNNAPQSPIRLATDGGSILGANGLVFRTGDLSYAGSLSNSVLDAVSRDGNWVSIRAAGTATQLQTWTNALFFDRDFTLPGVPYRVFTLADGRVLGLASSQGPAPGGYSSPANSGRLIFSIVDLAGAGTITSSPNITTEPAAVTIYRGQSASIGVVATGTALTYQWRRNGIDVAGATNATFAFASAQSTDSGSYAVLIGSAYGSILSATAAVTVQDPPPAPVISSQPQASAAVVGSYVSFYVSASGTSLAYQWRKDGSNLAAATSYSYTIANVTSADFGSYDVVVSNPGGSVTSTAAVLSLAVAPVITTQPTNNTTPIGGSATFAVAATGSPAPSYRWQRQPAGGSVFSVLFDGDNFSGTASTTLTVSNATLAMNGDLFRCVVTNGFSPSPISNNAVLTVSAAPVFTSGASTTFVAGVPGSFVFQASGAPPPTFMAVGLPAWAGLNAASGVLSGTPPSTAGSPFTFTVTASNGALPNASQNFTLTVQSSTGAPTITSQPVSQFVGAGADVTFSVIAAGAAPLTYQWLKDGAIIAAATNATYAITNVSIADSARYSVLVSNVAGSVTSSSAFLSVLPAGVSAMHGAIGGGYVAGGSVTIVNTVTYPGTAASLGWQVVLPEGWSYVAGVGEGDTKPVAGATSLLEWAWVSPPASPATFSYTLNVPSTASGNKELAALVILRTGGAPVQFLAQPDPLVLRQVVGHSADTNGDGKLSLLELTRVIELYNTRNGTSRTGSYRTDIAGEDGFATESTRPPGTVLSLTAYHSADANHDGYLSLLELTRVIELYNYRNGTTRTGQYHAQPGTEDGFAAGP